MVRILWRLGALLLPLWLSPAYAEQETEARDDDPGLSTFVTRPDIRATKWKVKIYHEDLIAPGYWFVGPYRILEQTTFGHGWVGAHIYDWRGELIWSGADMFSQGNIEDFRISNVRGEYLMTLMDQGREEAIVLDNHYEVRETAKWGHFNSHELHFVENGTRALIIQSHFRQSTEEMAQTIGYEGGTCGAGFDRFLELDLNNNWEPVFEWDPFGKIGLDESTLTEAPPYKRCAGNWDYLHANSVDKTDDGDYLYSGRHTDTIYKISKDDGRILWRLGGVKSDFPISEELVFTRQHDVRFRGQNETHMLFSMLDNAKGIDHTSPPSHEFSRGLLIAINEKDMIASIEAAYDHPGDDVVGDDRLSPRRGNYQVLPNGNIFMGWSEQGVQSEHSPDGTLLFESVFAVKWLGTYRQYKFPFVGEPTNPPDIHAEAVATNNGATTTIVHVSWNGATEVVTWNLYKTGLDGSIMELLASVEKVTFETALTYNSLASNVVVKAIDKRGEILGSSGIFKTIVHQNVTEDAIAAEDQWLRDNSSYGTGLMHRLRKTFKSPVAAFFVGIVCSAVILIAGWFARQRGAFKFIKTTRYHKLKQDTDFDPFSEDERYDQSVPLRQSPPRKGSLDD